MGEQTLDEWKVLPSIFTRAMAKSNTQPPDGYHTFDELAQKIPRSTVRSPAGNSSDKTSKALMRSTKTGAFGATAYDDLNVTPPLPQLGQTGMSQMAKTASSFKSVAFAR